MNKAIIIGRLTADPELRTTTTGVEVTSFAVATNSRYGSEEKTFFIDCVAWRKTAEFICKYFSKGSPIALTGAIEPRFYEDKDGNKRKVTEIIVDNVEFVPKQKETAENTAPATFTAPTAPMQETFSTSPPDYSTAFTDDEDLPF